VRRTFLVPSSLKFRQPLDRFLDPHWLDFALENVTTKAIQRAPVWIGIHKLNFCDRLCFGYGGTPNENNQEMKPQHSSLSCFLSRRCERAHLLLNALVEFRDPFGEFIPVRQPLL